MRNFMIENDNCFVLIWEGRPYLNRDQMEKILPILKVLLREDININNDKFVIPNLSDTQISKILSEEITEKIIVSQIFEKHLPSINHRIFKFEVKDGELKVKFAEIGSFNSFDDAIEELTKLYQLKNKDKI